MKETLKNLVKAYIGESQARNRYTFYAKVAQKEGFEQIAEIFLATAEQEKTHAKRLFEFINEIKESNDEITIEVTMPNIYGDTKENLKAAIAGETYETETMYPKFAQIAEDEGYQNIANHLRAIAIAEKNHQERYKSLLDNIENDTVFKKKADTWWVCRECGYIHFGSEAPKECPSCNHPQSFYQVRQLEY